MAVVTRWFDVTAGGAGDGTSFMHRAALFTAGVWSPVITGFAFNASDSLVALIAPGNYTCSQTLASGIFANPPIVANPLLLHGCDSSGVLLAPSDPEWTSDQPVAWDSTLPVIATTTNVNQVNQAWTSARLLKFTASHASATVLSSAAAIDWCVVVHSGSGTGAIGVSSTVARMTNSFVSMTAVSYRAALIHTTNTYFNVRCQGITGSSGNRHGVETSNLAASPLTRLTVFGFGGDGISGTSATASHYFMVYRSVLANNGGTGVKAPSTASQSNIHHVIGNMITGNGTAGLDAGASRMVAAGNRLRDNTTNLANFVNYPTDWDNFTTDSDDGTEYVDATNFDFRIKNTAAIWGLGYGVSDEPAAGGGGGGTVIQGTPMRRGMV